MSQEKRAPALPPLLPTSLTSSPPSLIRNWGCNDGDLESPEIFVIALRTEAKVPGLPGDPGSASWELRSVRRPTGVFESFKSHYAFWVVLRGSSGTGTLHLPFFPHPDFRDAALVHHLQAGQGSRRCCCLCSWHETVRETTIRAASIAPLGAGHQFRPVFTWCA